MTMIFGFDTATRCTGWCAGDGSCKPAVDVFRYDHVEDDLGLLARMFVNDLNRMVLRFGKPQVVVYEAPLIKAGDTLLKLRKLYGMGMVLEAWATGPEIGALACEVSNRAIKKRMTGNHLAEKSEVVRVVRERLKITLPEGKVEEDAADALGAWLAGGVQHYAKEHLQLWDQLILTGRGSLI